MSRMMFFKLKKITRKFHVDILIKYASERGDQDRGYLEETDGS